MGELLDLRSLPEWRPDAADLLSGYATVASGVVPAPVGYRPAKGFHTSTADMSALTARCQGAAAFISPLDQLTYIVAGDATKLYQNRGGIAFDASKSGGYTIGADENWEFASVDGRFIAAHIGDAIQAATMNGNLTFANLVASTLQPRARHLAVVGRQLMIGNTIESGVAYPNRVRWCAIDANGNADPTDFDESQTTLADHQDVEDELGAVQRILGGSRSGLVLCSHGIARADFVGTPDIYAFVKLPGGQGIGCLASGSVADSFFLSRNGFAACDGLTTRGIADEKINTWFFDNWYGPSLAHRVSACTDSERKLYIVAFPSTAAGAGGNPDTMLFFHIPTAKWSYASITCELIANLKTRGTTLEELDTHPLGGTNIDAMTVSLDSPIWAGGNDVVIGFNSAHEGRSFTGANLAATFEGPVEEMLPGRRVLVDSIQPLCDGGTLTTALAMRERLNDAETFGAAAAQNAAGFCPFETGNAGRYAKTRLAVAAAGTWNHLEGYRPEVTDLGAF